MLSNSPQVGTYSYPASGAGSVRPHAVTTAGSNSYTYDANGNMSTGAGRTFTYDFENRPTTIVSGGQTTTFTYDGDGGRVKKQTGSSVVWYISKLYECDTTSCQKYIWSGDKRIAVKQVSNGQLHFYHGDHLGSTSVVTDVNGNNVQALTYYPFGQTRTNVPGTPINVAHKYTGKELDSATGLYWYEWRSYDPLLARFTTPDTLVPNPRDPQDLNRYSYVNNNPLRYTDPTGHFKIKFKTILRVAGWIANPMLMQFADPFTRNHTVPVAAGVIGTSICGPVCGGAASGAVGAFMQGGDVGRGAWMGAAAGAVGWAVGGAANNYFPGNPVAAGTAAGAAAGATRAALGGDNVWQGALISGAVGAASGYMRSIDTSQGTQSGQRNQLTDAMGKIGNIPNTIIGLAWGGLGMMLGADVSLDNNAIQFTNHPFTTTAVTLGNTISYSSEYAPGKVDPISGYTVADHERQHTYQGQQIGPLYLPSNLIGGSLAVAINQSWHGPLNWNERGPQATPPRPW
jgi:RHS repeat-associated protein